MDIAEHLFNWFVASTLMASAVAVVVLAVQHLFRRRIHARLRHALWLIVLLRLMLPVLPQSPVSLFNAVPAWTDIKNAVLGVSYQLNKPDAISEHSQIKNTYQPYYTTNEAEKNTVLQPFLTMKDTEEHITAGIERESHPAVRVLAVVWLTGAGVLLGYNLTYWLRFQRKQKHLSPVDSTAILKIAEECRNLFSMKRPVGIYVDPSAQSPYITGVFRPAVYLPKSLISEAINEQLLKHVIAHELAHYKRKDTIWNMVGGLVFGVHWMNPFVWFMLRQMKADRELACDACVLEALGEEEAVPYGMTIIGFLRRYAAERSQAHLLYFKGSNDQKEMMRRIRMIQSFKKGSYKFSMMAVILVLLIGTATLTNARASGAGASAWVHAEDGGNEMLFPNEEFRVYDNLEKGAKVAPFKFKVPSLLPEGYGFSDLSIQFDASPSSVHLSYETKISKSSGNFSLRIKPGTDLQKQYDQIFKGEQDRTDQKDSGKVIEKESLSLAGIDEGYKITIRMTTWKGQPERYYYIWKDQGISYELSSYILSSNEMEQMIASMKLPDAELNKLHEDNEYHGKVLTDLYDTEDIRRAQKLVGFKAAFPRKLPGDFAASSSYVSRKANFNHVENDEDSMRKLFNVTYSRGDHKQKNKADSGIRDVSFKQMLNGDMYQEMKKKGQVSFTKIDGEGNNVKLTALTLQGKEVLRTEPYNLDGKPKGPNDLRLVSYFWFDGKVCYQAIFSGQGPEEQKIVQYLMKPDR
ncbi:M48 family metalloprotease [Paenibacillus sp. N3/727]|uniref:M56 family metallopeptidase n=1 Tax=Paenibacillus sp. N3/727 TaxID=2925845 RepID=UPI001F534F1D|nr:M56 family metallopeptidase [Paenibacillus sp. N3/727]UNK15931.1 M48 family metalloprotease [Paenibacillus sp. N3/727]